MIKRVLFFAAVALIFLGCNPREPRANSLRQEVEEIENDCGPKGINYGPLPGD